MTVEVGSAVSSATDALAVPKWLVPQLVYENEITHSPGIKIGIALSTLKCSGDFEWDTL
jgi:hypothetical protein